MKGVIIPTVPGEGLPPYYDPHYDPLWAACQEFTMPVHVHGGGGTPDYGNYGVVSMLMYATEATYFSQRNLWILLWGGVFERFPRLQVVFTETRADWVPGTLALLDGIPRGAILQPHSRYGEVEAQRIFRAPVFGRCVFHGSPRSRHAS